MKKFSDGLKSCTEQLQTPPHFNYLSVLSYATSQETLPKPEYYNLFMCVVSNVTPVSNNLYVQLYYYYYIAVSIWATTVGAFLIML